MAYLSILTSKIAAKPVLSSPCFCHDTIKFLKIILSPAEFNLKNHATSLFPQIFSDRQCFSREKKHELLRSLSDFFKWAFPGLFLEFIIFPWFLAYITIYNYLVIGNRKKEGRVCVPSIHCSLEKNLTPS